VVVCETMQTKLLWYLKYLCWNPDTMAIPNWSVA